MNTHWIQTFRGRAVSLTDPTADDIDPTELAILSGRLLRFGGHTQIPFTNAEHQVRVALLLKEQENPSEVVLAGLLHDAHEAYLGFDPTRPFMEAIGEAAKAAIKAIQGAFDRAIAARFGFDPALFHDPAVKHADNVMLATEARDLMLPAPRPWAVLPSPHHSRVIPRPEPAVCYGRLLAELTGEPVDLAAIRGATHKRQPFGRHVAGMADAQHMTCHSAPEMRRSQ